ncbi:MAG TPA: hypothetical protein VKJ65_00955, partial [Phycisphaerae bacterium]|nr:hypothetical protein [Phycisphaerae bacterium]
PFSCGVDSSYTILRHSRGLMGRRNRKIGAALVMNGFDIWLDEKNAAAMYAGLLEGARAMLKSINVPCIPLAGNFHELPTIWADSHGTHLASGLMLFAGRFVEALIPNSTPYNVLEEPWGSHPACDPYMGGEHFRITDDAGENARSEKIRLLSQWPEAMRHLRVCYSNPGNHENCCRCGKCIRTILVCRMVGIDRPEAFKKDVDNYHICRAKLYYELGLQSWTELRKELEACGMGKTSWVKAMRTAERHCHRRRWMQAMKKPFIPLRNQLRKVFRGSALSKKQIANSQR